MNAKQRREEVLRILNNTKGPISATKLAQQFDVSRQIIVGDIALLRAAGEQVTATPRGYVMAVPSKAFAFHGSVACVHDTTERMQEELNIMVDNGCTVIDVIVEHPVYGQITGALNLSSRYDVSVFIDKVLHEEVQPLSKLTGGVHIHTLSCDGQETYDRTCRQLKEAGLLFDENNENS